MFLDPRRAKCAFNGRSTTHAASVLFVQVVSIDTPRGIIVASVCDWPRFAFDLGTFFVRPREQLRQRQRTIRRIQRAFRFSFAFVTQQSGRPVIRASTFSAICWGRHWLIQLRPWMGFFRSLENVPRSTPREVRVQWSVHHPRSERPFRSGGEHRHTTRNHSRQCLRLATIRIRSWHILRPPTRATPPKTENNPPHPTGVSLLFRIRHTAVRPPRNTGVHIFGNLLG